MAPIPNTFMQLYNTKVVPSAADAQWVELPVPPNFIGARLLVITSPFAPGSAEEQTLQKMMAACKLGAEDYTILTVNEEAPYSWNKIAAAGAPEVVLMLGINPAVLSIHALFRLNAPNAFLGHTFIPSLSLSALEQNAAAKKDLWASGLKPIFGG
jgi:hypothetical protein